MTNKRKWKRFRNSQTKNARSNSYLNYCKGNKTIWHAYFSLFDYIGLIEYNHFRTVLNARERITKLMENYKERVNENL